MEAIWKPVGSEEGFEVVRHRHLPAPTRRADGRTLHVRTATVAEPAQKAVYDALGIDPDPGGTRRTVV